MTSDHGAGDYGLARSRRSDQHPKFVRSQLLDRGVLVGPERYPEFERLSIGIG